MPTREMFNFQVIKEEINKTTTTKYSIQQISGHGRESKKHDKQNNSYKVKFKLNITILIQLLKYKFFQILLKGNQKYI